MLNWNDVEVEMQRFCAIYEEKESVFTFIGKRPLRVNEFDGEYTDTEPRDLVTQ